MLIGQFILYVNSDSVGWHFTVAENVEYAVFLIADAQCVERCPKRCLIFMNWI